MARQDTYQRIGLCIRIIDTNTMGYSYINSSKGKVINFGSLSEEGLQVTIDGVNRILLENGSLR